MSSRKEPTPAPHNSLNPSPPPPPVPPMPKARIEYCTVWNSNIISMELEVNNLIAEGWIPQGGIAVDEAGYLQAMTRKRR